MTPTLEMVAAGKSFAPAGLFGRRRGPPREVLKAIDFTLAPGTIIGLQGDNGSGKSTLLRLLAGLLLPTCGEVRIDGTPMRTHARAGSAGVGILLPHNASFYWRLSCRENLRFFAALWGIRGRGADVRIEEAVAAMGLAARLDDPVMTLSSGLMQRLSLARLLVGKPRVWLLDEPTRELDSPSKERVYALLRDLRQAGGSALFVSHTKGELAPLCDAMLHLSDGSLHSSEPGGDA